LTVLVFDDLQPTAATTREHFEILVPSDVGLGPRALHDLAAAYDSTELACALKPLLLRHLLKLGDVVVYLDPELELFARIDDVVELARAHSLVLAPQIAASLPAVEGRAAELEILRQGMISGGMIALSRSARPFLDWWSDRLRWDCVAAPESGLYLDQRWLELGAYCFEHALVRDPGVSVGTSDLRARRLTASGGDYRLDGSRLRVFRAPSPTESGQEPAVNEIVQRYGARLAQHGGADAQTGRYPFAVSAGGLELDGRIRRIYGEALRAHAQNGDPAPPDPFDADSATAFVDWLSAPAPRPGNVSRYLQRLYDESHELQRVFPDLAGADGLRFLDWARGAIDIDPPLHPFFRPSERAEPTAAATPAAAGAPAEEADTPAENAPHSDAPYAAAIEPVDAFHVLPAARHVPFHVLVRNIGTQSWPGDRGLVPVMLGHVWLHEDGSAAGEGGPLNPFPRIVAPGESIVLALTAETPAGPGQYLLEVGLLRESLQSFERVTRIPIVVRPAEELLSPAVLATLPEPFARHGDELVDRIARICGVGQADAASWLQSSARRVEVAPLALRGLTLRIRPRSTDVCVLEDVFWTHRHLPPATIRNPRLIVDLGCYTGLTTVHYAQLFPEATVVGVEMDPGNAGVCRENIAAYRDRCMVFQMAVAGVAGWRTYGKLPGDEWAHSITDANADAAAEPRRVRATTIDALLSAFGDQPVDLLKLDVEGAEAEILGTAAEWPYRTRALTVEVHAPYTAGECIRDLERLGFDAYPFPGSPEAVYAYRRTP